MISLPLRNTFCQIKHQPLLQLENLTDDFRPTKQLIEYLTHSSHGYNIFDDNLFLNSADLLSYLRDNPYECNDVITIASPDFRDIYWNNRKLVGNIKDLEFTMTQPLPEFRDIFDNDALADHANNTPIYYLHGNIDVYDTLYIPITEFIDIIQKKKKLQIKLSLIDITIELTTEKFDFFDFNSETVNMKINQKCGK